MAPRGNERATVAQHARLTSQKPVKRLVLWIVAAVTAVILAVAGVATFFAVDLFASLRGNAVDIGNTDAPAAELKPYPGAFTMMVIGTDECDDSIKEFIGIDRCTGDESEHHLNDVNIMVHVSEAPRRVTVVSFPRDLRVERAECTDVQGNVTSGTAKINTAYEAGGDTGLKCVADTVSALTGIPIDFAAKLSFVDVIKITDAIGGVDVCVAGQGIKDPYTNLDLAPGMHTVKGREALQFLRTRHGLEGGSDISRISNQQQYMSSLVRKLRSDEVLADPVALVNLATVVAKNMQADTQLADPVRMAQLALSIKDVPFEDITFVSFPVVDANDGTYDVLASEPTATNVLDGIKNNQPLELERAGSGVVEEPGSKPTTEPSEGSEAPEEPADPAEPTDPPAEGEQPAEGTSPSPTPTGPVKLDWSASGQTAAEQTCSAGVHY